MKPFAETHGSILTGVEMVRRWLEVHPETEEVKGLFMDIDNDVRDAVLRITGKRN